jgi:hypothetical protein
MKKILLLAIMAVVGLTASAQRKTEYVPQSKAQVANRAEVKRSFQAVAPFESMQTSSPKLGKKLTLDAARLQTLVPTKAAKTTNMKESKVLRSSDKLANKKMNGLKPYINYAAGTMSKAPAFQKEYTGMAKNYLTKQDTAWTMTPALMKTTLDDGSFKEVDVLLDIIPLPEALKELYPEGLPVEYTLSDDGVITVQPQTVAWFKSDDGVTYYVTLCSANSDNEDGAITMSLADDGVLKIIDGNWIGFADFANEPFDEEMFESENFSGFEEVYTSVRYVYDGQKSGLTVEKEYNAHGVDLYTNTAVIWKMMRGTWTEEGEDLPVFVNLSPLEDMFSALYPDGIYVDYIQEGSTVTITPQVIAIGRDEDDNPQYYMIFSGTADDGNIVLTIADNGAITTIDDESIMIAAWSTEEFDPNFGETYLGWYQYIDRVKYMLPDAEPEAPVDVACEPNELVLFAGLGASGYSYLSNLGVFGAYAPVSFRNATLDIATNFKWTVTESFDDEDKVITGDETNFSFETKGDAVYTDIKLVAFNKDKESAPYTYGYGHAPNSEKTGLKYEDAYFYGGAGASGFYFSDGSYATMTRQNPDGDLTFYTNWGTPDLYERASISTIYSYQGKPSTPLFITGVTLPMVAFSAQEDFNLHIKLYNCTRTASGRLALGELIAEGDATIDNVNEEFSESSGITSVDFDELYVEDEFGMSETLDYLFIDDEFVVVIEGWDNGTFSGVLGSQDITDGQTTSSWFEETGGEGRLRSYTTWFPQLFVGLIDATYGYLYTEDNTNLKFDGKGGEATIHINPMYYSKDEETEEPTYNLLIEKILVDGEEVEEIPEWLSIEIANEDYTTAVGVDEDGEEYTYFVNGIDYDMIVSADPLSAGEESRNVEISFMQIGARLVVTVDQAGETSAEPGDVNGDGSVDVADISNIITIMASDPENLVGDVNGDGVVDVADISAVITIMAGN